MGISDICSFFYVSSLSLSYQFLSLRDLNYPIKKYKVFKSLFSLDFELGLRERGGGEGTSSPKTMDQFYSVKER